MYIAIEERGKKDYPEVIAQNDNIFKCQREAEEITENYQIYKLVD